MEVNEEREMRSLFEKASWAAVSLFISVLSIYILKPETIISQQIIRSIDDLSLAHGEGYSQNGNCFVNEEENAYFVYDLGEGTEKYEAIDLFFETNEYMDQQNVVIDLYHSGEGSEVDKVLVSGKLLSGENKVQFTDDFGADRFIRLYVRTPVGQPYTISSIGIENHALNINIISLPFILIISLIIYFIGLKLEIIKLIFNIIKCLWSKYDQILNRCFEGYEKYASKHSLKSVNRTKFLICILSQVIILILMIMTNKLLYATNDDTTMIAIAGGGYVVPSQYIVNMHIVIGYLLKGLFTAFPVINWVTVLFLLIYAVSFICMDKIIVERSGESLLQFAGNIIILDICFILLLGHFTFTVVAYTAIAAGIMAFVYAFDSAKRKINLYYLYGLVLFILAALIRAEALKTLILLLIPICVFELIINKNIKYLILEILTVAIMVSSINSDFAIINNNAVERNFLNWGELRSKALDCAVVPYDANVFNSIGISSEEYNACYNAFYYIKDAVSEEKMEHLIELNNVRNKYNFDLMGFIIEHFSYITDFGLYKVIYKWLFVIILLFNLFLGKKETVKKTLLVWVAVIGVEFLYYFIKRSLYRVVMPTYVIGIVLLISFSCCDSDKLKMIWNSRINYKKLYSFGCILLVIVCAFLGRGAEEWEKAAYSSERHKVLEYMEKNNDKLFLAGNPAVFSVGVCESVWDYAGKDFNWNLIGNWEIYSVPSNNLMEHYGYSDYENIAKYAVNNDNILILTTYSYTFEDRESYILDLYEKYYGIRPRFEKVEDICINKVSDMASEDWAVYKLVYTVGE